MKSNAASLHKLVHSLTSTEKGYVLKNLRAKNEKQAYAHLFRKINAAKAPDPEKLNKWIQKYNLPEKEAKTKDQLYEMILNSLTRYHHQKNASFRLDQYLKEIQFLCDKGLFQHAMKRLATAKKVAKQNELREYMFEIACNELEVLPKINPGRSGFLKLEQVKEELDSIAKDVMEEIRLLKLSDKIYTLLLQPVGVSPAAITDLARELLAEVGDHIHIKDYPVRNQYIYYSIRYLAHGVLFNDEAQQQAIDSLIKTITQNRWFIETFPDKWLSAISNQAIVLLNRKDLNRLPEVLTLMNQHQPHRAKDQTKHFQLYYRIKMLYLIQSEQLEKVADLEKTILRFYDENTQTESGIKSSTYAFMGRAAFVHAWYKKAILYFETAFQCLPQSIYYNTQNHVFIMWLICLYEEGLYALFDALWQQYLSFLRKAKLEELEVVVKIRDFLLQLRETKGNTLKETALATKFEALFYGMPADKQKSVLASTELLKYLERKGSPAPKIAHHR